MSQPWITPIGPDSRPNAKCPLCGGELAWSEEEDYEGMMCMYRWKCTTPDCVFTGMDFDYHDIEMAQMLEALSALGDKLRQFKAIMSDPWWIEIAKTTPPGRLRVLQEAIEKLTEEKP